MAANPAPLSPSPTISAPRPKWRRWALVVLACVLILTPILGYGASLLLFPSRACGCVPPPAVTYVAVTRDPGSGRITVQWQVSNTIGIAGYDVYAGRHRLTERRIAAHHGQADYVFSTVWRGTGAISVHQVDEFGAVGVYTP